MQFFREYIAPFLILLIFVISLFVMIARSFITSDLLIPAPISFIFDNSKLNLAYFQCLNIV
ncbi:hypothetical protein CPARK_000125700 [cyanobacterium endosymbiont of Braarudosphaera bigelowii]|uniref:ABC transporter permease n=1 Tax=cyanobacterium endosymbiont of Braarudosphaera bigelowii TaxID=1285375 RepID=A0ABM7UDN5_9CHRO|nr:hypothetical protein CPARK_000125700 [cyanobacterium endosymbiont of Braarudosphaera bigelowii]